MSTDRYDEILSQAKGELTQDEQQRLAEELSRHAARKNGPQQFSIMDLKGLGKNIWRGINADEYIAKERDSWDG